MKIVIELNTGDYIEISGWGAVCSLTGEMLGNNENNNAENAQMIQSTQGL